MCLYVCLSARSHISKITHLYFTNVFCTRHLWPLLSSSLMVMQYNTSVFVDDHMFPYNGGKDDVYVSYSLPGGSTSQTSGSVVVWSRSPDGDTQAKSAVVDYIVRSFVNAGTGLAYSSP